MKKILIIVALVCIVLLVVASLMFPRVQYRRAVSRFPLGTSLATIESEWHKHYVLHESGNVLGHEMTEQEKQESVKFYIHAEGKRLLVYFNSYTNLVGIRSMGHPILGWWEEIRGHLVP